MAGQSGIGSAGEHPTGIALPTGAVRG